MLTARLFTQPKPDFTNALLADINAYIQKNENDCWKKTGVARAKELKDFILTQLIEQEELTTTQLMWRLFSYVAMTKGSGRLGTSTELRNVLVDNMCVAMEVNKNDLVVTLKHLYRFETDYMVAAANVGVAYWIDHNTAWLIAKLLHVKHHLVEKGMAAAPVVSTDLKDILLNAIDAYKIEVNAHWYKRWFKQSGLMRAEELTRFISDQLGDKECLTDAQLCARVLEMATMEKGDGMLGTSKDLRIALMRAMSSWPHLQLNETEIAKEVSCRSEPVISPAGFAAYFPDVVTVEVGIRATRIRNAMRNLHVVEQRNGLSQ